MKEIKIVKPARFWLNISEFQWEIYDTKNNWIYLSIVRTANNMMEAVDLLKELNEREKLEKQQLEDEFFNLLEKMDREPDFTDADLEADSFMYANDQELRGEL